MGLASSPLRKLPFPRSRCFRPPEQAPKASRTENSSEFVGGNGWRVFQCLAAQHLKSPPRCGPPRRRNIGCESVDSACQVVIFENSCQRVRGRGTSRVANLTTNRFQRLTGSPEFAFHFGHAGALDCHPTSRSNTARRRAILPSNRWGTTGCCPFRLTTGRDSLLTSARSFSSSPIRTGSALVPDGAGCGKRDRPTGCVSIRFFRAIEAGFLRLEEWTEGGDWPHSLAVPRSRNVVTIYGASMPRISSRASTRSTRAVGNGCRRPYDPSWNAIPMRYAADNRDGLNPSRLDGD